MIIRQEPHCNSPASARRGVTSVDTFLRNGEISGLTVGRDSGSADVGRGCYYSYTPGYTVYTYILLRTLLLDFEIDDHILEPYSM